MSDNTPFVPTDYTYTIDTSDTWETSVVKISTAETLDVTADFDRLLDLTCTVTDTTINYVLRDYDENEAIPTWVTFDSAT